MKLSKAIEILQDPDHYLRLVCDDDIYDAIKLGIEALKRVKHVRTLHKFNPLDLLLGETKEDEED